MFYQLMPFVLIAMLVAVPALLRKNKKKRTELLKARIPLTKYEQPMYFRLIEALPEHIILAQVAFSTILTAKTYAARNTFNRKVADFVVCSKAFEVIAVVELDDASHKGAEEKDGARDALLQEAGYRVLRYKRVPDLAVLKNEFTAVAV